MIFYANGQDNTADVQHADAPAGSVRFWSEADDFILN